jgi:tetratricopeptide (TPR) repeat protein
VVLANRQRTLLIVAAVLLIAGCGSPEQRAARYLANAESLFAAEEFERAKLEAKNAIQIQPRNLEARWLLAQIARAENKVDDALQQLPIVIEEDPGNADARIYLAEIILASGNVEDARELVLDAAGIDSGNAQVLQMQARLALLDGETDAALDYLDALVAQEPGNVAAALQRGLTLLSVDPQLAYADLSRAIDRVGADKAKPLREARIDVMNLMGQKDAVADELRALLADYPDDQNIVDNATRFFLSQGDRQAAEQVLRSAVEAAPDDEQAVFSLARFQSATLREPDLAERTLQDFVAAHPENLEARVMLGTFYEGVERMTEAREVYGEVIDAAPDTEVGLAARNRMAATLVADGDLAAAARELDAVLAVDPGNVAALQLRGELAFAERRYSEAVSDLRRAVRASPGNEYALVLLARSHAALGAAPLAEDVYRRVLEVSPASAEALGELGVLLQQRGQYEDAEALYARLLALDDDSAVALSGLAETAIARRELDAAEGYARRLIDAGDPRGIGSIQLGKVLQAREQPLAAADSFENALLRDPASEFALKGLVGSLTVAGELDRAGSAAERFLANNPGSNAARILLGGNLVRRGELEAARGPLEEAIAADPGSLQAYIVLSSTFDREPDQRARVFRRGLEANPGQPDLTLLLGSHYTGLGRPDDAIAVYERSLEAYPDVPRVANNLASLLLDYRDDADSHRRALKLVRGFSDSSDPAQLDTLGWAYLKTGDARIAVQFLERALAGGQQLPVIHYHLAKAYAASGDRVGAERQLAEFLSLVPAENPRRAEAEAEIRQLLTADAA